MDAVKFVQDYIRLCAQQEGCDDCPIYDIEGVDFCSATPEERSLKGCEKLVTLVDAWALKHPIKTRYDIFLEYYPNAPKDQTRICPRQVDTTYDSEYCKKLHCAACAMEYWEQAVEYE